MISVITNWPNFVTFYSMSWFAGTLQYLRCTMVLPWYTMVYLHTRTAVARLPLHQLHYLVLTGWRSTEIFPLSWNFSSGCVLLTY